MRQQKDISVEGHNIRLEYNDSETDLNQIDSTNVYRLVEVCLIPSYRMSEAQGKAILDKYESHCYKEIREVISENESFFKNFNVRFHFSSEGCVLDPPTKALISMERRLEITLKENNQ